jgi:hypothetical protein
MMILDEIRLANFRCSKQLGPLPGARMAEAVRVSAKGKS